MLNYKISLSKFRLKYLLRFRPPRRTPALTYLIDYRVQRFKGEYLDL